MKKFLDRLLESMSEYGIVNDEDSYDIVRYGAEMFIMKIIFLLATILVGIITHSLMEITIFMIVFQPLRTYGGGYHSKTKMRCFISSVLLMFLVVFSGKVMPEKILPVLSVASVLIGGTVIFFLAPIGTPNKPLDEVEKIVYRKRTRLILTAIIAAGIIILALHRYNWLFMIALGLLAVSLLLILGKFICEDE
ncbi:MAG: accessory gene regulator B family protein [Oscillospiraceae bacterium]|nr:accessory gene regulator B family protein [Oscillospiraceae bacterium]